MKILLLVISICALIFIINYIRKNRVQIEDTLFWIVISLGLVVFATVPAVVYYIARILQIQSPANFVFMLLISILLVNEFYLTMKVSSLQIKIKEIAQRVAVDSAEIRGTDRKEEATREEDSEE